jgi:hypothetical protein
MIRGRTYAARTTEEDHVDRLFLFLIILLFLTLNCSDEQVSSPPSPDCVESEDCDDGDPCTADRCDDGICVNDRDPACGGIWPIRSEEVGEGSPNDPYDRVPTTQVCLPKVRAELPDKTAMPLLGPWPPCIR